MRQLASIVPTLRDFLTPKRNTLRGIAPDPNVVIPRDETWEDETPLPKITRDEVLKFVEKGRATVR